MVAFMQDVTLEENWDQRVFQEAAIATWKHDVVEKDWRRAGGIRHGDFTDAMFECVRVATVMIDMIINSFRSA